MVESQLEVLVMEETSPEAIPPTVPAPIFLEHWTVVSQFYVFLAPPPSGAK
jgi:hypothetical protein